MKVIKHIKPMPIRSLRRRFSRADRRIAFLKAIESEICSDDFSMVFIVILKPFQNKYEKKLREKQEDDGSDGEDEYWNEKKRYHKCVTLEWLFVRGCR